MYNEDLKRAYLEDLISISKIMNVSPEDLLDNPEDYERLVEDVEFENSNTSNAIIVSTFEVDDEIEK